MVVEQENKQAYYLCSVKKKDGHTIVNRGNICLKLVTNKGKNKKGFKATYSQGELDMSYQTHHSVSCLSSKRVWWRSDNKSERRYEERRVQIEIRRLATEV